MTALSDSYCNCTGEVTIELDEEGKIELFGVKHTPENWAKLFQTVSECKTPKIKLKLK